MNLIKVRQFTNPRTASISYRAYGRIGGKVIRRNFSSRVEAESFALVENQAIAEKVIAQRSEQRRFAATILDEAELAAIESAKQRLRERISIPDLIALGESALAHAPKSKRCRELIDEWLALVDGRLGERWQADLRARLRRFAADNPKLDTAQLTQPLLRRWLDGLAGLNGKPLTQVSKMHFRAALSRWCGWLVQTGYLAANPCKGLIIDRPTSGTAAAADLPAILSPAQARALLDAVDTPARRRALGWVVLCLFCGLRPEAEAKRLQWAEVDLEAGRLQVYGRKRGASVRIVELQPAAVSWLRYVRGLNAAPKLSGVDFSATKEEQAAKLKRLALLVGQYSRRLLEDAVAAANVVLQAQELPPIKWEGDIMRHTYASMRSPTTAIHDLAREMGTSAEMLHRHYRHPVAAAVAEGFWQVLPQAG